MRINKQNKKLQLVCDPDILFRIAMCLSQSPDLSNRKIAFDIQEAMKDMEKRIEKKKAVNRKRGIEKRKVTLREKARK